MKIAQDHALAKLADSGLDAPLPRLECFSSRFTDYEITLHVPEYTSVCPKTGHPDFGVLTLTYVPARSCVELKAFKHYIHAYRNLGIAYENAVNRIARDFRRAVQPRWLCLVGEFTPRGGIRSTVKVTLGKRPIRGI